MNDKIEPGEGYRLLELGETVESGDEFHQERRWYSADWVAGTNVAKTWRPVRRKLPATAPSTGWIKCSERVPAMHERVLATGNGTPFVGAMRIDGWTDVHTQSLRLPTHWMPLPAPPEPEKDVVELAAAAAILECISWDQFSGFRADKGELVALFKEGVAWAKSQKP